MRSFKLLAVVYVWRECADGFLCRVAVASIVQRRVGPLHRALLRVLGRRRRGRRPALNLLQEAVLGRVRQISNFVGCRVVRLWELQSKFWPVNADGYMVRMEPHVVGSSIDRPGNFSQRLPTDGERRALVRVLQRVGFFDRNRHRLLLLGDGMHGSGR